MLKELKLQQKHIDYVKNVLALLKSDCFDELKNRVKYDDAPYAIYKLLARGFVEKSHKILDGTTKNVTCKVKLYPSEWMGWLDGVEICCYDSPLKTECNEYCPDGSPRIEGYTHHLDIDGYSCEVLKWRDNDNPDGVLIFLNLNRKVLVQTFVQKLLNITITIYSYINDLGNLVFIGYDARKFMTLPRSVLRENENSINMSFLEKANKKLRGYNEYGCLTDESRNMRYADDMLDSYLDDICENYIGAFAARAIEAEIKHGEGSIDAKREHDLAKDVMLQMTEPKWDTPESKAILSNAKDLAAQRKQELQ